MLDVERIFANRSRFANYVRAKLDVPAEPTYHDFSEWASTVSPVITSPATSPTYWLISPREAVRLEKVVYKMLHLADSQGLSWGQIFAGFDREARNRLLAYLVELENKGLISFVPQEHSRHDAERLAS